MTPTELNTRIQRAVALIGSGNLSGAQMELELSLRVIPGHPDLLQLLGLVHRRAGRGQEAIDCLRASLASHEKQPNVHNNLGNALAEAGQPDKAVVHLRRALALKPDYADAACNLAILLLRTAPRESEALLKQATQTDPNHGRAFETLGVLLLELGHVDDAIIAAKRAVDLNTNSFRAWHNLGQAEIAAQRFQQAEYAFSSAVRLNPSSDASWIGLGNSQLSLERPHEAVGAFEKAVAANPSNVDAHRLFNETLWQAGDEQRYLFSYPAAIRAKPSDANLRLVFAQELMRVNQPAEALVELEVALRTAPGDPRINDAFGRAFAMRGDFDQAIAHHKLAVASMPGNSLVQQNYLETLFNADRSAEALDVCAAVHRRLPHDQGILAFYTTALQLNGDAIRHDTLADYNAMTRVIRIDPPEGYADEEAFNTALAVELRRLHATKNHPTDQTLRGGTQTFGALFSRKDPLIGALRTQIERAIADFIADMPDEGSHPFYGRKCSAFTFSGSWSARLRSGGFHTNHFHPKGWISSAYYVSLPPVTGIEDNRPGWLKMGEANFQHGSRGTVQRFVQPRTGHLVLFPSYFWHGTVPFQSQSERLTVAFDVIPQ